MSRTLSLQLLLTMLVVSSAATTGVAAATTTNDEFEPNDTRQSAAAIDAGTYEDLTLTGDERDVFELRVGAGEPISVTVTVPKTADGDEPANEPVLSLVDANGDGMEAAGPETTAGSGTLTYQLDHEFESPQTVYLAFEGRDDVDTSTSYDLTLRRAANDPNEPDGVPSKATAVSPGTHTGVLQDEESDYFSIDVSAGETLNATMTVPKSADGEEPDNDVRLALVTDEELVTSTRGETATAARNVTYRLYHEFRTDRNVYVRVYGTEDSQVSTPYTLRLRRGANDPNEPNGVLSKATAVEPGNYSATLLGDESDYYSIDVAAGETLNATVTVPKAADGELPDNGVEVEMFDAEPDRVDTDARVENDPAAEAATYYIYHEFRTQGTAYLRVAGEESDADVRADYDLQLRRGASDANEPDGVRSKATAIGQGTHGGVIQDLEHDYYTFPAGPGPVNVTMTVPKGADGEPPENYLELELQDAEGGQIASSDGENDPAADAVTYRLEENLEERQTVYVEVQGVVSGRYDEESDTTASYTLAVSGAGVAASTPTPTPTATPAATPTVTDTPAQTATATDAATPSSSPASNGSGDDGSDDGEAGDGEADDGEAEDGEAGDGGDTDPAEDEPTESSSGFGPGFGVVAALLALLALAGRGRRQS